MVQQILPSYKNTMQCHKKKSATPIELGKIVFCLKTSSKKDLMKIYIAPTNDM